MTETPQTLSISTSWTEDAPTSSAQMEPQLELLPEQSQTAPKPACATLDQIDPRDLKREAKERHNDQLMFAGLV